VAKPSIEHVVVLMLENRSFDHMLGYLDQGCLPPVSTSDGVPEDPTLASSPWVPVSWLESYNDVTVDPGHKYADVMCQLTGTMGGDGRWSSPYRLTNSGFVWNYARHGDRQPVRPSEIMGCYPERCLPVISSLARSFALCTRWHCSLPSETWPNRLFAHAGTSFGAVKFELPVRNVLTIYDLLKNEGFESRVYAGDFPQVLTFGWHVAFELRHMDDFDDDVRTGDLPAYTFIEPRYFDTRRWGKANSQHPTSRSHVPSTGWVPRGETLIARVFTALRSNANVWAHTLLIVTYDEHGGFYDRLPPREVEPTGDVARNGFRFDLLGPRVPALVVSPYIPPGVIVTRCFDHTSITATVREVFGLRRALSERERKANTVTSLLELPRPRADDELPSLEKYTNEDWFDDVEGVVDRPLDDFQRQLLEVARELDPAVRAELEVTAETTMESVVDAVEGFVERNYPPAK
jgi:phospholipase C